MGDYLKDRTNFDDMPLLTADDPVKWGILKNPVVCPSCLGHGGWNLALNKYGPGKHFQAYCAQCGGHGHVEKGSKNESCIHKYRELSQDEAREKGVRHYGMCYHVYECVGCGSKMAQDSSD